MRAVNDREALENLATLHKMHEEAKAEVARIESQVKPLKKLLAEAKDRVKQTQRKVDDALSQDAEPNLFNGGLRISGADWKDSPVTVLALDLAVNMRLAAVKIATMGDLSEWHRGHRGYNDIPGVGREEVNDITEAMHRWLLTKIPKV